MNLGQGCIKLVSMVSRIPDKLLRVRQMTKKIMTKKGGSRFLNIRQIMKKAI